MLSKQSASFHDIQQCSTEGKDWATKLWHQAGLTAPMAKITQEASRQMLIGKLMMDGRLAFYRQHSSKWSTRTNWRPSGNKWRTSPLSPLASERASSTRKVTSRLNQIRPGIRL